MGELKADLRKAMAEAKSVERRISAGGGRSSMGGGFGFRGKGGDSDDVAPAKGSPHTPSKKLFEAKTRRGVLNGSGFLPRFLWFVGFACYCRVRWAGSRTRSIREACCKVSTFVACHDFASSHPSNFLDKLSERDMAVLQRFVVNARKNRRAPLAHPTSPLNHPPNYSPAPLRCR